MTAKQASWLQAWRHDSKAGVGATRHTAHLQGGCIAMEAAAALRDPQGPMTRLTALPHRQMHPGVERATSPCSGSIARRRGSHIEFEIYCTSTKVTKPWRGLPPLTKTRFYDGVCSPSARATAPPRDAPQQRGMAAASAPLHPSSFLRECACAG